jgi:hypothetical protein
MVVFTPDDEPYLGRESVFQFDTILQLFIEEQTRIGARTREAPLSALQRAAAELVPSASSIALSIRELVRQGYLLSAHILMRPLFERVATLSHLIENPADVSLWQAGWPHKSRPPLGERIRAMRDVEGAPGGDGPQPSGAEIRQLLDGLNGLVHGDPTAALHGAILMDDGSAGFTIGKDVSSPNRADEVCFFTTMMLVVLLARSLQLFPRSDESGPA